MFEDIKKMLPARVKATFGLLIEPHFLERTKIAHKKPTGDGYQYTSSIDCENNTITLAESNQYESIVNANLGDNLFGENEQLSIIENYTYVGRIATKLEFDKLPLSEDCQK